MHLAPSSYLVFVDFENVPVIDLGSVHDKPAHVTLLIGKNQKKLDLALVRQIHRLHAQVELVEVGASGHNALDLTLAFYLGKAVGRTPDTQFCVVSRDKDFDPMIAHLQANGVKVTRHETFATLPFLPAAHAAKKIPVVEKKPAVDRRTKVIDRLRNPATRNRPLSRKALVAHIKAALGKEATDDAVDEMLRELIDGQDLTIDAGNKVTYAAVS